MARITGIGGVFFKSDHPAKTAKWYRDALGLDFQNMGGDTQYVSFAPHDFAGPVFSIFDRKSDYMDPSAKDVMINLMVDNVDEALEQVRAHGGQIVGDIMSESYGDFGWFIDPEGRKIELWTPKKPDGTTG
jgi:predicted enzyme related to lactoylglutathione lyase